VEGGDTVFVDVVSDLEYSEHLYGCLPRFTRMRLRRKRLAYVEDAKERGLGKEVIFKEGEPVGMIEYAPAEVSAYSIRGPGTWVMNCIWVLRRVKGHRYGRMLFSHMLERARGVAGIATIALEDHPSPWLKLRHMEHLGFSSIDSRRMRHRVKRPEVCFKVHLMWRPLAEGAARPAIDWGRMLRGVDYCSAHPLYRAESLGIEEPFEFC
jgi:GNAT superfamily N-acetyltransferase